ncbi:hypothetical protein IF188_09630 [Microbacterium sp. NEAU-LLC]|uniref:Phage gp6-like head-tail connector protein n=1 Tax=Microbacterium helvum TaxID=2773713 RepID=A0ABR8NP44_9MICO|nr:hypothetical protein [Microbacterium helvum]MBD3941954.1 hypothetical protein [Microbacterium helvum]
MAAPVYPDLDELTKQLARYVDVKLDDTSADAEYVEQCAAEAQQWLTDTIGTAENVPVPAYERAALEVGSQLFRRRNSWSNIDPMEAPAVPPVRSNPYTAAYPILAPYIGPVMA